jgi:hypothetical protein
MCEVQSKGNMVEAGANSFLQRDEI